jgi:hypothetical protein
MFDSDNKTDKTLIILTFSVLYIFYKFIYLTHTVTFLMGKYYTIISQAYLARVAKSCHGGSIIT